MRRFGKQGLAGATLAAMFGLWSVTASLAGKPGGGGATGPSYQIVELDSQANRFEGYPFDLNNAGLVVGAAYDLTLEQGSAACWTVNRAEGTSVLHLLDGEGAFGVNDAGEIVGSSNNTAAYWQNRNATPRALPVPAGSTRSIAEEINSNGVICGWAESTGADGKLVHAALVWRVSASNITGPVVLPKRDGNHSSQASHLNDNDAQSAALVVGEEWDGDNGGVGMAWTVTSLANGTLAVDPVPDVVDLRASATGVNKSDVICGYVHPDAVVWDGIAKKILDRSATIAAFGGRKACNSANAYAINAGGVIVGHGSFAPYSKAVVWTTATSPMILLDKFLNKSVRLTELNAAVAVNDLGDIVGNAWDNNRSFHPGFLAISK